jgi:hypothetical protein
MQRTASQRGTKAPKGYQMEQEIAPKSQLSCFELSAIPTKIYEAGGYVRQPGLGELLGVWGVSWGVMCVLGGDVGDMGPPISLRCCFRLHFDFTSMSLSTSLRFQFNFTFVFTSTSLLFHLRSRDIASV